MVSTIEMATHPNCVTLNEAPVFLMLMSVTQYNSPGVDTAKTFREYMDGPQGQGLWVAVWVLSLGRASFNPYTCDYPSCVYCCFGLLKCDGWDQCLQTGESQIIWLCAFSERLLWLNGYTPGQVCIFCSTVKNFQQENGCVMETHFLHRYFLRLSVKL